MALLPRRDTQAIEAPQAAAPAPDPAADKSAARIREAQAARRAAEQRAEELTKQLAAATLEVMRLKAEIYDLQHGLA